LQALGLEHPQAKTCGVAKSSVKQEIPVVKQEAPQLIDGRVHNLNRILKICYNWFPFALNDLSQKIIYSRI